MRTIKFRGKRHDDCEWVYGSLIVWRGGMHGIMSASDNVEWRVDPATVGQFTGLTMNGAEIWEGDKCRPPKGMIMEGMEDILTTVVSWDEQNARWSVPHIQSEVVGNIHEEAK